MTASEQTKVRIISAVKAGVKIRKIANDLKLDDISYYRLAAVLNPDAYKTDPKFTDREVGRINEVLDSIADAFKAV